MANVDQRFGLKPVDHLLGLNWSDKVMKCYIPSTDSTRAMFIGDAVDLAGSADATGRYPTVSVVTVGATYPIFGVIVGFDPDPDNLSLLYRADDTNRYCYVCVDPYVIYEIQGCSSAVIGAASVGLNGVLVATHSGDTATGLSGLELDSGASTAPAAAATYQLLILGAVPREDNDISAVNAKWRVMISLHRLNSVWQVDTGGSAAQAGLKGV
jgi:hypothetical protein